MKNKKNLSKGTVAILRGLEKAYAKMVEFKKYKNTPLVIEKNGEILEIEPSEIEPTATYKVG